MLQRLFNFPQNSNYSEQSDCEIVGCPIFLHNLW